MVLTKEQKQEKARTYAREYYAKRTMANDEYNKRLNENVKKNYYLRKSKKQLDPNYTKPLRGRPKHTNITINN